MMELDRDAVETLCLDILAMVRDHFRAHSASHQRVFESLNALAMVAGTVIAGAAPEHDKPLEFFMSTVRQQIDSIIQENSPPT